MSGFVICVCWACCYVMSLDRVVFMLFWIRTIHSTRHKTEIYPGLLELHVIIVEKAINVDTIPIKLQ